MTVAWHYITPGSNNLKGTIILQERIALDNASQIWLYLFVIYMALTAASNLQGISLVRIAFVSRLQHHIFTHLCFIIIHMIYAWILIFYKVC